METSTCILSIFQMSSSKSSSMRRSDKNGSIVKSAVVSDTLESPEALGIETLSSITSSTARKASNTLKKTVKAAPESQPNQAEIKIQVSGSDAQTRDHISAKQNGAFLTINVPTTPPPESDLSGDLKYSNQNFSSSELNLNQDNGDPTEMEEEKEQNEDLVFEKNSRRRRQAEPSRWMKDLLRQVKNGYEPGKHIFEGLKNRFHRIRHAVRTQDAQKTDMVETEPKRLQPLRHHIKQSDSIENFMDYLREEDSETGWTTDDDHFARKLALEKFEFVIRNIFLAFDIDATGKLSREELQGLSNIASPLGKDLYLDPETFIEPGQTEIEFHDFRDKMHKLLLEVADKYRSAKKDEKKQYVIGLTNFEREVDKFGGIANVYETSFAFLYSVLVAQLCFLSYVFVDFARDVTWTTIIVTIILLAIAFLKPILNYQEFSRHLRRALGRIDKKNLHGLWIGFVLMVTNVVLLRAAFLSNMIRDSIIESILPWENNFLSTLGIAIITLWRLKPDSRYAFRRDADMLKLYPVACPVDQRFSNGFEVLDIIYRRATESRVKKNRGAAVLLYFVHFIPTLILPLQWIIATYMDLPSALLQTDLAVTSYNFLRPRFNGNDSQALSLYIISLILGCIVVTQSSVVFHQFLEDETYYPFCRNHRLMQVLLSITSPIEASKERVPYLPLKETDNLTLFSKITQFLHTHEQGGQLGQASTGFAALLFVDVVIISSIVIFVYFSKVTKHVLIMSLFVYYAIFVTLLSFRVLFKAIEINRVHENTIARLFKITTEFSLMESCADAVSKITAVREELANNFRPITILGIPATPTLLQVFVGYLVSALAAIIGSNFVGTGNE